LGAQHIAAGDSSGKIFIINKKDEEKELTLLGHNAAVTCLKEIPAQEMFLSASADQTVRLWDYV